LFAVYKGVVCDNGWGYSMHSLTFSNAMK